MRVSVCISVSISMSVSISIAKYLYLPIYISLSIHLSICPSIHLSNNICMCIGIFPTCICVKVFEQQIKKQPLKHIHKYNHICAIIIIIIVPFILFYLHSTLHKTRNDREISYSRDYSPISRFPRVLSAFSTLYPSLLCSLYIALVYEALASCSCDVSSPPSVPLLPLLPCSPIYVSPIFMSCYPSSSSFPFFLSLSLFLSPSPPVSLSLFFAFLPL